MEIKFNQAPLKNLIIKMPLLTITADETQFALLTAFCDQHRIDYRVEFTPETIQSVTSLFKTPCTSLKGFCGPEMMTSRGKMQPSAALQFILDYARKNGLIGTTVLQLNDILQAVFQTDRTSIPHAELAQSVNALFTD